MNSSSEWRSLFESWKGPLPPELDALKAWRTAENDNSHSFLTTLRRASGSREGAIVTASTPAAIEALRIFQVLNLYASLDPGPVHYSLTRAIIPDSTEPTTSNSDCNRSVGTTRAVDLLARSIVGHAGKLRDALGWDETLLVALDALGPVRAMVLTAFQVSRSNVDLPSLEEAFGPRFLLDPPDEPAFAWWHGGGLATLLKPRIDVVAAFLETVGPTGKTAASQLRESDKDPWKHWLSPEWKGDHDCPTRSPIIRALARALWSDLVEPELAKEARERDRAAKVPTPSVPLFLARILAPIPREAGGRTLGVGPRGELSSVDWGHGSSLMAPAAAQMMLGPAALDVAERDALKALPLVVEYLARLARAGWLRGEPRFDYVPLWTGRDSLRETFGAELTAADIEAALDYLEGHSVAGFPCVAGVSVETGSGDRAGRPRSALFVQVGLPLTPMGLERIFGRGGREVPSELRWYAPVLNPRRTPLVGNRRTAALQRSAYTLGLGCILTDLRQHYLERGGITLSELLKGLRAVGLYHRQHHSLADEVAGAWTGQAKPDHPTLPGFAPGRVFIETAERSGIWRLSDDLADVHAMIIGAGELSRDGRENRKKWAKRQPRRPNKRRIT